MQTKANWRQVSLLGNRPPLKRNWNVREEKGSFDNFVAFDFYFSIFRFRRRNTSIFKSKSRAQRCADGHENDDFNTNGFKMLQLPLTQKVMFTFYIRSRFGLLISSLKNLAYLEGTLK